MALGASQPSQWWWANAEDRTTRLVALDVGGAVSGAYKFAFKPKIHGCDPFTGCHGQTHADKRTDSTAQKAMVTRMHWIVVHWKLYREVCNGGREADLQIANCKLQITNYNPKFRIQNHSAFNSSALSYNSVNGKDSIHNKGANFFMSSNRSSISFPRSRCCHLLVFL